MRRLLPARLRRAKQDSGHPLLRAFGFAGLLIREDPSVTDRFLWVRREGRRGGARTLDAGCGAGVFSIASARWQNVTLGVSNEPGSLASARERAAILGGPQPEFRALDLGEVVQLRDELDCFDQVFILEVLEHLENDADVLGSLVSLLAPAGRVLFTVPTAEHLPLLLEHETSGHVRWGYSSDELTLLTTAAGLEIVSVRGLSGLVTQELMNASRRLGRIHPRLPLALVPLRVLMPLDRLLSRWRRRPFLSHAVVARRVAPIDG